MHIFATMTALALATLKVGDAAPDFTATDSAGAAVSLAALRAQGPVVLAFFPKPFTPGCSQEMAALQKGAEALKLRGVQVVAISRSDSPQMAKFKLDRGAGFPFVADDGRIIKLYDVAMTPLPMARRVTFLIDKQGLISHIYRGTEALDPAPILRALPPI